jgi:hypothetical protein
MQTVADTHARIHEMGAAEFEVVKTEPPALSKGGRPAKYPWSTIPVGHSFFISQRNGSPSLQTVRNMAVAEGKRRGMKFSVTGSDARCTKQATVFQIYRSA